MGLYRHYNEPKRRTVTATHKRILKGVEDLEALGVRVNVLHLCEVTKMNRGTISSYLTDLITEGLLRRVEVGVFASIPQPEAKKAAAIAAVKEEPFIRPIPLSKLRAGRA